MAPAADSRPSRIVRIGQIVPSSNTTMETEIRVARGANPSRALRSIPKHA
jgi:maleate cis-trans isomerase